MWYVILLVPSITGLWLAAKHWYGWLVSALSEVCWATYSVKIGASPLLVMSAIWFAVHSRNCWVTYRSAAGSSTTPPPPNEWDWYAEEYVDPKRPRRKGYQ
jgi:hypothetical protein